MCFYNKKDPNIFQNEIRDLGYKLGKTEYFRKGLGFTANSEKCDDNFLEKRRNIISQSNEGKQIKFYEDENGESCFLYNVNFSDMKWYFFWTINNEI